MSQRELSDFHREKSKPAATIYPRYREDWLNLEEPLIVLEKIKQNAALNKMGLNTGRWPVGYGVFMCSMCRRDGTKHKLKKVKHLDYICEECASKYQMEIKETLKLTIMLTK